MGRGHGVKKFHYSFLFERTRAPTTAARSNRESISKGNKYSEKTFSPTVKMLPKSLGKVAHFQFPFGNTDKNTGPRAMPKTERRARVTVAARAFIGFKSSS